MVEISAKHGQIDFLGMSFSGWRTQLKDGLQLLVNNTVRNRISLTRARWSRVSQKSWVEGQEELPRNRQNQQVRLRIGISNFSDFASVWFYSVFFSFLCCDRATENEASRCKIRSQNKNRNMESLSRRLSCRLFIIPAKRRNSHIRSSLNRYRYTIKFVFHVRSPKKIGMNFGVV